MKRNLCMLLSVIILAGMFSGCNGKKEEASSASSTSSQESIQSKEISSIEPSSAAESSTESEQREMISIPIMKDTDKNFSSNLINQIRNFIMENNINMYDVAVMTEDYDIEVFRAQFANACNDSYSVSKVYTLTAIGMLVDEGKLKISDKVYPMFKELFPADHDKKWEDVTVENVMAHRIGIETDVLDIDSNNIQDEEYLSRLFALKIVKDPGSEWNYTDAAYYLLSRIVSKAAGENMDTYLRRKLFTPMEVQEFAWSECTQGYPMGATGLYIRSEDEVKLAWAYLNGGEYKGTRYFSKEWADKIVGGYELGEISQGIFCKFGINGQAMLISKNNNFVVAWHGFVYDDGCDKLTDFIKQLDAKITSGEEVIG